MSDEIACLNKIAQAIYDKKGVNILVLDVRGVCTMTDFFVIAEGTSDRHVKAVAQTVSDTMKKMEQAPLHVEGETIGDWVVIDYGDMVIHLFMPGLREKYALENLWHEGKIVDVKIQTSLKK